MIQFNHTMKINQFPIIKAYKHLLSKDNYDILSDPKDHILIELVEPKTKKSTKSGKSILLDDALDLFFLIRFGKHCVKYKLFQLISW